jgi:Predicted integral membrane protein
MPAGYLSNPLMLILNTLVGAYIFVLIVRVLLQYTGADSRNPVSSFINKLTRVPLKALKPIFPTVKNISLAAVALALMLQMVLGFLAMGGAPNIWVVFIWSLAELIDSLINVFIYSIFAVVIISWINPGSYNPAVEVLHKITEPVLKPFRRLIPPVSGMDLSPIAALLALQVLKMLLIPPLFALI